MDELTALSEETLAELNEEQSETVSPPLYHYFNGCCSQLDFFVPQIFRIPSTVLGVPALATAAVVVLRRRKRRK